LPCSYIYVLSLHDALPISDIDDERRLVEAVGEHRQHLAAWYGGLIGLLVVRASAAPMLARVGAVAGLRLAVMADTGLDRLGGSVDRKSTRLNSSHVKISYA